MSGDPVQIKTELTIYQVLVLWSNLIIWLVVSFFVLSGVNIHLFTVLLIIFMSEEQTTEMIVFALISLFSAWLYGRLFFDIFMTPGAKFFIPSREVWSNPYKTFNMMSKFLFVGTCSGCVIQYYLLFFQGRTTINFWLLIFLSISVILWILLNLMIDRKKKISKEIYLVDIPSDQEKSIENKAFKKINSKLSEIEKQELIDLLYKSERVSSMSVQNIARVVWMSCGVALIIEIIEELIKRM